MYVCMYAWTTTDHCVGVLFIPLKVMEYVGEKASLYELGKTVRAWERKVEIAEVCSYVQAHFAIKL